MKMITVKTSELVRLNGKPIPMANKVGGIIRNSKTGEVRKIVAIRLLGKVKANRQAYEMDIA